MDVIDSCLACGKEIPPGPSFCTKWLGYYQAGYNKFTRKYWLRHWGRYLRRLQGERSESQ